MFLSADWIAVGCYHVDLNTHTLDSGPECMLSSEANLPQRWGEGHIQRNGVLIQLRSLIVSGETNETSVWIFWALHDMKATLCTNKRCPVKIFLTDVFIKIFFPYRKQTNNQCRVSLCIYFSIVNILYISVCFAHKSKAYVFLYFYTESKS